jgi:outer membrane protein W
LLSFESGLFAGDNKWSFDHPIHYGSSTVWETVEGKASGGIYFEGGLQRMKRHLGIKLAFGFKPSKLTVFQGESIAETHIYEFSTNYIKIEADYYFRSGSSRVRPYLGTGLGYILLTGDSKTNGTLINLGSGINIRIIKIVSITTGVDFKLIKYLNFDEGEGFSRTINILPVIIHVGISFKLK